MDTSDLAGGPSLVHGKSAVSIVSGAVALVTSAGTAMQNFVSVLSVVCMVISAVASLAEITRKVLVFRASVRDRREREARRGPALPFDDD